MTDLLATRRPTGAAPHGVDGAEPHRRLGNAITFASVVRDHQTRVAGLVRRLLGWSDDIEDVVQDVFLAVFENLPSFRGDCRFETWLYRITVNRCRSFRRRRFLRLRLARKQSEPTAANGRSPPAAETFAEVRRAVRSLPMRYREVIVLRYLEEMTVSEMAGVLRLSRNTVEVRLSRARARLKGKLVGLITE